MVCNDKDLKLPVRARNAAAAPTTGRETECLRNIDNESSTPCQNNNMVDLFSKSIYSISHKP
jgi:hypothetical protein